MKKTFFGVLVFVLLTTPAFATSHNAVHADNWLEQVLFFGLPGAAIVFTYLRGKMLLFAASLLAFFGPIIWGIYRVASMDGPWNYIHFAKHHAEVGMAGAILGLVALVLVFMVQSSKSGFRA